jgi:hypothetical protein
MFPRATSVAAAIAAAAILTPALTAVAKDDPAVAAAAREKVRAEYKAKKWYPFSDLKFFVDSTKLKDQRWEFKDVKAPEALDEGGAVYAVDLPSGNPNDATPSIRLFIQKWPHYKQQGSARATSTLAFKSWGKSVEISNVDQMCEGFYQDWLKSATDPIKDKCKPPEKKGGIGPAKLWGYAVATDKDSKKRERHDWFAWTTTDPPVPFTYMCEFTVTDSKFIDNEDWMAKIPEFMKNMKELKDGRLK